MSDDAIVAIVYFLFLSILAICTTALFYLNHKHKENMARIEKGESE